eukprot:UN26861
MDYHTLVAHTVESDHVAVIQLDDITLEGYSEATEVTFSFDANDQETVTLVEEFIAGPHFIGNFTSAFVDTKPELYQDVQVTSATIDLVGTTTSTTEEKSSTLWIIIAASGAAFCLCATISGFYCWYSKRKAIDDIVTYVAYEEEKYTWMQQAQLAGGIIDNFHHKPEKRRQSLLRNHYEQVGETDFSFRLDKLPYRHPARE